MRALFLRSLAAAMVALVLIQLLGPLVGGARPDREAVRLRNDLVETKLDWATERVESRPDLDLHALERSLALHLWRAPADAQHGPRVHVRPLSDGTFLVAEPAPRPPPPIGWILLQVLLATGAFGLVLVVLGRPLLRDLETLERTAGRIAVGDLSARTGLGDGPVADLGRGFDAMAERVEGLVRGQTELLHAVSHELRTPMARMRFLLERLPESEPTQAIDAELDTMDTLLGELLAVLRLEAAPTEVPEPEGTQDVVRETCERLGALSDARIELELVGTLAISRRDLSQVVGNLVSNATRHANSLVRVRLDAGLLVVEDDGPGIPEALRARVFEPFHTGDESRSRTLGGVGLGLTLVHRAVSRWKGTIEVGTSPLGGARFEVRLPG